MKYLEQISAVKLAVYASAMAGVVGVGYVAVNFGYVAGLLAGLVPLGICGLIYTIDHPARAMMALFVVNYFIMGLSRILIDQPIGFVLDVMIWFNIFIVLTKSLYGKVEWRLARNSLTLVAIIWLIYCILQAANTNMVSMSVWLASLRSYAFYFISIVILASVSLTEFKYLKTILAIWSVLTVIAVAKSVIQKYIGFSDAENYWLFVLEGRRTHILATGIRYFSFFSDAANYGASMGLSMVVFSISALYYKKRKIKIYFFAVAAIACYGMLISGTRSALAVPFVGYVLFVLMSRRTMIIFAGSIAILGAFVFLNYTTIGHGNSIIRRARSAFDTNDKSLTIRMENQAKLRELMKHRPFGIGMGYGGNKAATFGTNAEISDIPTDSWFVMVWVETGIVGLILHICILLYILCHGMWLVMFRLKNPQVKGLISALVAGMGGIMVASYANEIFGQFPTGAIMYISMALIFLAPHFDRQMNGIKTDEAS